MEMVEDVACTICGCVCDDLRMTVEDGRISSVVGACHLSESWFLKQESKHPPVAQINGEVVLIETAIDRVAEILSAARWPLIYGLSRSSTDGQRAAVRLADAVGGNTALRKWTEKKGVQFAQKIAGHASERYIWRYVTSSESDMDQAAESHWELVGYGKTSCRCSTRGWRSRYLHLLGFFGLWRNSFFGGCLFLPRRSSLFLGGFLRCYPLLR